MLSQLCIRNVRTIDPESGRISSPQDILVEEGCVKKIGVGICAPDDCHIMDADGAFASPGWVDVHTHFDQGEGLKGFDLMRTYPTDGVTCALDAGSRGPAEYESMYLKISSVPIPLKTYLYVAKDGMRKGGIECKTLENLDKDLFLETCRRYPDTIIGVKIRIDPRVNCDTKKTLKIAKEYAREANLPLIVHPTRCEDSLEDILAVLEQGDVYAHSYSQLKPCILDERGTVKPCVREARSRGVYFDLSHGSSNFSYEVGRKAVEQDFPVDVISTDLHAGNVHGPVCNLADTMSKCLHIGMTFEDVIRGVTVHAVKMTGITEKAVAIKEGERADLTIFQLENGRFPMEDSMKTTEVLGRRFVPKLTVYDRMMFLPREDVYWV